MRYGRVAEVNAVDSTACMPTIPKVARADHDDPRAHPAALESARVRCRAAISTRDDLLRLFEAARWAPSSRNEQPWRFVVDDRGRASPRRWQALLPRSTPRNQAWAAAAPVLVLAAVRLTTRARRASKSAWRGTTPARPWRYLTLQATSQGLRSGRWKASIASRAREACQVPAGFEPAVVMAVGYAGDPDALAIDKHRAAERCSPRERQTRSSGLRVRSAELGKRRA